MADTLYGTARQRVAELEKELERLRSFLTTYDELAAALGRPSLENERHQSAADGKVSVDEPRKVRPGRRKGEETAALLDEVEKMLQVREPLSTKELLEKLAAIDIEVGGADKAHNLANYLGRDKQRFVNRRGLGWFLVNQVASSSDIVGEANGIQSGSDQDPAGGLV